MGALQLLIRHAVGTVQDTPLSTVLLYAVFCLVAFGILFYTAVYALAPTPRLPILSEKTYMHITAAGPLSGAKQLPCWQDQWRAEKQALHRGGDPSSSGIQAQAPDVFVSLVIPAYNEQERLGVMIKEAVEFLQEAYPFDSENKRPKKSKISRMYGSHVEDSWLPSGWEILLVSDGSTDGTVVTALDYARTLAPQSASAIRVVQLVENRGKGGAVTHGLRHVRGAYAIFADADGATRFADLEKLVVGCQAVADDQGRGVAVGSRAHLVGSEAVVRRSFLRNFLMHSFHLLLRLLTPPATGRIRDTQCGFKLFSRQALPFIVPYMHCDGWIFDVEMLMLAESAGIPVTEVPVGWKEVVGSKLNVLWDSLGMAWGLALLRLAWGLGVYRRW